MPQTPIQSDFQAPSSVSMAVAVCVLSFARGLVLLMVMALPVVMLRRLGMSNTWASLGMALMALPFVARGWLRPVAEMIKGRRWTIAALQGILAVAVYGVAHATEADPGLALWGSLTVFSLTGAIHDILASDMTARWCESWQAHRRVQLCFVGAVLAAVLGMGITMVMAGDLEVLSRRLDEAWQTAMMLMAALLLAVALLCLWTLPRMPQDTAMGTDWQERWTANRQAHQDWWAEKGRWSLAVMIIVLSLHQWMLWRATLFFLIDPGSIGGLSLGPQGVGFAQGTVGALALTAGCVLGIGAVGKEGLGRWPWPMVLALTLSDMLLLYLSYEMPSDLLAVSACLLAENLLTGFGMAGLSYYLFHALNGDAQEAHADIVIALLAVSALVAGAVTGFLLDVMGYRRFFFLVVIASLAAIAFMEWKEKTGR